MPIARHGPWTRGAPCGAPSTCADATTGRRPWRGSFPHGGFGIRGIRVRSDPSHQPAVERPALSYWQATTPAAVAGATGAAVPMKSAQKCGYASAFVDVADHPLTDASTTTTLSPCDDWNFSESRPVVYRA